MSVSEDICTVGKRSKAMRMMPAGKSRSKTSDDHGANEAGQHSRGYRQTLLNHKNKPPRIG